MERFIFRMIFLVATIASAPVSLLGAGFFLAGYLACVYMELKSI